MAQSFAELGLTPLCRSTGSVEYGQNIVKRMLCAGQLVISTRCQKTINAMQEWEYGSHEPDILAALRYACVYALERRLVTVTDIYAGKTIKAPTAELPKRLTPNMVLPRRRANQDLAWDMEEGVPND